MSALPPRATVEQTFLDVSKVPTAEVALTARFLVPLFIGREGSSRDYLQAYEISRQIPSASWAGRSDIENRTDSASAT